MSSPVVCPHCNTPNRTGAKFCSHCAKPLPAGPPQQAQQAPSPVPAPQPARATPAQQPPPQPIRPMQQPVAPPPPPTAARPPAQPPRSAASAPQAGWMRSKWVWLAGGIGLAVILAAIIGGAAWFLFGGDDEEAAAVTPAPTAMADVAPTETATATAMPVETPPPADDGVAETEPTAAPPPTSTPAETPSPPPVPAEPTPTSPPSATPPSEAQILFEDDFETGLNEAWNTEQANISLSYGQLYAEGTVDLKVGVGDQTWTDYLMSFELGDRTIHTNLSLLVRMQDDNNYLKIECAPPAEQSAENEMRCLLFKVIDGVPNQVPGIEFRLPSIGSVEVEAKDNIYRVNNDVMYYADLDPLLTFGGVEFYATGQPLSLAHFKVEAIP